jgi:hypothetical protein
MTKYIIIFALGVAVGTFGVVSTINATGRTISKVVEVGTVVVDSVTPVVKEGIEVAEKGIEKVSK